MNLGLGREGRIEGDNTAYGPLLGVSFINLSGYPLVSASEVSFCEEKTSPD